MVALNVEMVLATTGLNPVVTREVDLDAVREEMVLVVMKVLAAVAGADSVAAAMADLTVTEEKVC